MMGGLTEDSIRLAKKYLAISQNGRNYVLCSVEHKTKRWFAVVWRGLRGLGWFAAIR